MDPPPPNVREVAMIGLLLLLGLGALVAAFVVTAEVVSYLTFEGYGRITKEAAAMATFWIIFGGACAILERFGPR